MVDVAPNTIAIYADVACPWSTLAVIRLWASRQKLGLEDTIRFDLRAFPLELVNERATPRRTLDAEIPVVGSRAPEFGWQVWQGRADEYPVTTLLPLEAVQAAKLQSLQASEQLDLKLREAFFVNSRCISLRSWIARSADSCPAVDTGVLLAALDAGSARRDVIEQWHAAERDDVKGSPHVFLPDGTNSHNPGIEMHWEGEHGAGFPVISKDDPSVYDDLLRRAAG